jgi:FixH
VAVAVQAGGSYSVRFHLTPNRATRTGTVSVALSRAGRPVSGARLRLTVRMLNMNMGAFAVPIPERSAGTYAHLFPVVGMNGRWGFTLDVTPRHGRPFRVALADRMLG